MDGGQVNPSQEDGCRKGYGWRVAGRLSNLADAGGLLVEADDVVVATGGEQFAIDVACAADGFIGRGAFGGGAVLAAAVIHADFVLDAGLVQRGGDDDGEEGGCGGGDEPAELRARDGHWNRLILAVQWRRRPCRHLMGDWSRQGRDCGRMV
jgi:hypothetical protein